MVSNICTVYIRESVYIYIYAYVYSPLVEEGFQFGYYFFDELQAPTSHGIHSKSSKSLNMEGLL